MLRDQDARFQAQRFQIRVESLRLLFAVCGLGLHASFGMQSYEAPPP